MPLVNIAVLAGDPPAYAKAIARRPTRRRWGIPPDDLHPILTEHPPYGSSTRPTRAIA